MSTKVITPECRLAFPNVFRPRVEEEGKPPKYSVTLLFGLDADLTEMKQAVVEAMTTEWGPTAIEQFKAGGIKNPFRNQAEKAGTIQGYGEGFFITARAPGDKGRPGVVDANLNPIMDEAEVYGGLIVRASLNAFAWKNEKGGRGVSFGLSNLMIVGSDGTRYDNRTKAEEDFAQFKSAAAKGASAKTVNDIF